MRVKEHLRRLRFLFRKEQLTNDLRDEMGLHVELRARKMQAQGLRDAASAAQRQFGNRTAIQEVSSEMWGWSGVERWREDIRYAARTLRKTPVFTVVAVLTLAVGLGMNTAVFSVVNAVMIRSLPYPEPDRLVALTEEFGGTQNAVAPANLADYRGSNRIFSGLAGYQYSFKNMTGFGTPERVCGESVTADFFSILGVEPALGRTFLPEEDRPGGNAVVVVTNDFWQRRMGSDTDVFGRTVKLDGLLYQVVGVLPRGFQSPDQLAHPERIEFYVPAAYSEELLAWHGNHEVNVVGRLKPGVGVRAAQEELNAISAALQKQYRAYGRTTRAVIGTLDTFLVRRVKNSLLVLLGASGLIVLITCVNVANLLLMRAVRKRRETSVRFALGASRGRVVRQFLVESMLVAVAGCGAGILLGRVLLEVLLVMAPANIPRIAGVTMDWRVFAVSAAIATITGLMFGIAPAWQASRARPGEALKSSDKNMTGQSQMRWRAVFTVVEVALSLILLIGAGLLINSFVRLTSIDLGFRTDHILSMNVSLPAMRYRSADLRLQFFQQLEERVRRLPGVVSVAFANRLPLGAPSTSGLSTDLEPNARVYAGFQAVNPGYFETIGIPLARGRLLTPGDRTGQTPVAVVNQTFVRMYLPKGEPLGRRVRQDPQTPWITIVGVVNDIRRDGLASRFTPQIYFSAAQTDIYPAHLNDFGVRTAGDPHQLVNAIQQQIWAVDKDQTVMNVRTLDEAVSASVAERRFQTLLLGIFAAVAVGLAMIGLYGVLAYSVSQRTPELGIRIALGADPREILAMVLRQAGRLIAVGMAIGLAGAYALARFVESMLFGVRPHDAMTYLAAAALLAGVSVAASAIPARRGSKVDPMVALRYE